MQGLSQLLLLLASNAFLARALPIAERGSSVSSFTLSGWNDLCGSCFSDNLYFSNLCFELGSVGFNYALSESADICVQQQVADQMIFLAKSSSISVSESSELIAYAVGFNELDRSVGHVVGFSRSVSACTVPPVNPELSGSTSVGTSHGSISSIPTTSSSSIPVSGSSSSLGDGTSSDSNSTDISGNSTLTGSDSTNSTDFSGSNSTDTSNSTLTGSDSTNSTDTSGSDSTDTSSTDSSNSTDTSIATDSSTDTSTDTATATDTSVASATDSSTAATSTSSQTFDGNIHDPAGRRKRRML